MEISTTTKVTDIEVLFNGKKLEFSFLELLAYGQTGILALKEKE